MASIGDQVQALSNNVSSLAALVSGIRTQGLYYALTGSYVVFGCTVIPSSGVGGMTLALTGATDHVNPDAYTPNPARYENYYNIAVAYGEIFLMDQVNISTLQNANLTVTTAPGTGYHRYDCVYAYVGSSGPGVAIAVGTAVVNASTPTLPPRRPVFLAKPSTPSSANRPGPRSSSPNSAC